MLRILTVMSFSYMFVSSHANRDQIFSVAGLVPLLDQNLPKHQPNLTSAYRAKTHFLINGTLFNVSSFQPKSLI